MEESVVIHKLRNRHFYSWVALTILLPVGVFLALQAIPKEHFGDTISHQRPAGANVVQLSDDSLIKVSALDAVDNPGLEITLKKALAVPATIIYLASSASEDISEAQLLGQLDSKNTYYFRTGASLTKGQYLLLYDPINEVVFHKVAL